MKNEIEEKILRPTNDGWNYWCPFCEEAHFIPKGKQWAFSGTLEKPTFNPSIDCGKAHYHIRNGEIIYTENSELKAISLKKF